MQHRYWFVCVIVTLFLLAPAISRAGVPWSDAAAFNTNAATDTDSDYYVDFAGDGAGNWVVVWCAAVPGDSNRDFDIFVSYSTDDGANWSTPTELDPFATVPPEIEDDFHPAIATDGQGNWVATWYTSDDHGGTLEDSDTDLLVSRSSDNGATWTSSIPLNTDATSDGINDGAPQLATDGNGLWIAVWNKRLNPDNEDDYDLLIARSTDNGATWSDPELLHPDLANELSYDGSARIAANAAGHWIVVWSSEQNLGGTIDVDDDILVSTSTDGMTWTAPAVLNSTAVDDTLDDRQPFVATDATGRWLAVWYYGVYEIDYDIMYAYSDDDGATWSPARFLQTNAATDGGRDLYPIVAGDGRGNWVTVWQSKDPIIPAVGNDYDILYAYSVDNGENWSDPWFLNAYAPDPFDFAYDRNPVIACTGPGAWRAIWGSKYDLNFQIGGEYDLMTATATLVPDGDSDADGEVDLYDFARLQECFAPAGPTGIGCVVYDLDSDDDVDADDFVSFESVLTGPTP